MTGSICTGKEVGTRTDAKLRIGTRKHRGDRLGGKGARKPAKLMRYKENTGAGRCWCKGTAAHTTTRCNRIKQQ